MAEWPDGEALRRAYPDLAGAWVPPQPAGEPLLAPFVEVWSNLRPGAAPLPLRFVPADAPRFEPPALPARLATAVADLLRGLRYTNDTKLRIRRFTVSAHDVVAEFQASTYEDYLRTNWAVAELPPAEAHELRALTCGVGALRPLESAACANHLGVNAVVACQGELVFPVSSSEVVNSPRMVVPPVSGSAGFDDAYRDGEVPGPARDILREAGEELGLPADALAGASVRLLALTRNVLRGGKPEAVYAITILHGAPDPRRSSELRGRGAVRLPALLDEDERPVPGFDSARARVEGFVRARGHGRIPVSPVARVAAWYYVQWALARRHG